MAWGAWICLLSPLVAACVITLGGQRLSRRASGWLATAACFVAFGGAVVSFVALLTHSASDRQFISTAWTWITGGSYQSGLSVIIDPLSTFMMLIVAGVGALIVWYSIGYMDGDDEERRYFAYMSLFVFSMLLLVQAGNLLLLLAGWGMVGLSSYLLIGFWHQRPSAIAAAKKAFVMNAIGDATMARSSCSSRRGTRSTSASSAGSTARRSRTSSRSACSGARWRSRRRSRCTRGCPTRWKAPPPSARSSTRPRW
jgi:NADH-quinone oxidoreductase subunit L